MKEVIFTVAEEKEVSKEKGSINHERNIPNEYIEDLNNRLLESIAWAIDKRNIPEEEIGDIIFSTISEIYMRYSKKRCTKFAVGDVVDCNYGFHLTGETNGKHIEAIVCDISDNGMPYLVPLVNVNSDVDTYSHLIFKAQKDITYITCNNREGTVLLSKAKYVCAERINAVIGKTSKDFLEKVLNYLSRTFDFTNV